MKCPKCLRPVDHEAESCYSCGYSELAAATQHGANVVSLNRIHDAAYCLRKQERDDLNETLDQLELLFPQMLFCAYLGTLPEDLSLSELGFWMLNHGQVRGAEYARPNENAILVIMDMNSKQIGISLGYFAETLLSQDDAYRALHLARPNLLNAEYGEAISAIFSKLGTILKKKGKKLRKLSYDELKKHKDEAWGNVLDIPAHLAPKLPDMEDDMKLKTA